MALYNSTQEMIGNTPLVKLNHFDLPEGVNLYAKLELMNPAGSVKDRVGKYMIERAERDGLLRPGGTVVEATAGNTGLGIAFAALNRGYRVIFVVPDKFSQEKQTLMRALGAEIEWIDGVCIKGFWLPAPQTPSAGSGTVVSAFAKLGDRDIVTIARISLAVRSVLRGGRYTNTSVVVGAASQQPFFCDEAAAVLDGSQPGEVDREAFTGALANAIEASIPNRPTMPYKRSAVRGPAFDVLDKLASF